MRKTYFKKNGNPKEKGDFIYRPELAKTLELIATRGPNVFYEGSVGECIIQRVQSLEGGLTMEDLRGYEVKIRDPLIVDIGGFKVITAGAPTWYVSYRGSSLILVDP